VADGASISSSLKIKIPQYAIHTGGETGQKTKVVVIQAEEIKGMKLIGAINYSKQ
jgi:hypothetical protein